MTKVDKLSKENNVLCQQFNCKLQHKVSEPKQNYLKKQTKFHSIFCCGPIYTLMG